MMYTANQIASWFLAYTDTHAGDTISPMKLQKLIYYAQAFHLVQFDKPLFNDKIEAWMHGPTVPSIYERFDNEDRSGIPYNKLFDPKYPYPDVPEETAEFLEDILFRFGEHSAWFLETLSRQELPWIEARNGIASCKKCNAEITHASMKKFYSKMKYAKKPKKAKY
ncbi:Panacea domain-containing protein [Chitinophaga rhizosphaerae]|uniref:Panacea domain-containing protein n=1 Tax=Chitinophaga rhizosphaerae TaxID=1864947 RepID=UPI000F80FF2C|nr:type II toxin-antitoxin system antitoxin SocA domain-containing protein [Chitinophaga rhizosphaerae]